MKRIKSKKALCMLLLLVLATATATAQIFGLENESNNRKEGSESAEGTAIDGGDTPEHFSDKDQSNYTSLGSGTLLLLAFGGAYALKKRK